MKPLNTNRSHKNEPNKGCCVKKTISHDASSQDEQMKRKLYIFQVQEKRGGRSNLKSTYITRQRLSQVRQDLGGLCTNPDKLLAAQKSVDGMKIPPPPRPPSVNEPKTKQGRSASQGEPIHGQPQLAKKKIDRSNRYYRCFERGCGTELQLGTTFKRHLQNMHYHQVDYYCHHEGCRTNRQPFHRRDKIADHYRMTHGASPKGVPWNEIKQKMVSNACPPVCAVCSINVPDWSSFYECYANHCEIMPAPPKPGSSRQGNHGRGNKRRRPDSDDSDDDGADNSGPASSKKGLDVLEMLRGKASRPILAAINKGELAKSPDDLDSTPTIHKAEMPYN